MEHDRKQLPQFPKYFWNEKRKDIIQYILAPVRTKAGLGDAPSKYTTNDSEALNSVIK